MKNNSSISSFEHCATFYQESRHRVKQNALKIIELLHDDLNVDTSKLIEVGVGDGFWLKLITEYNESKSIHSELTGIDISEAMVLEAKKNIPSANLMTADIMTDNIKLDRKVNTLFMCMAFHLLPFPESMNKIVTFSKEYGVNKIVILEEVSSLYLGLAKNFVYLKLLPKSIEEVVLKYNELRIEYLSKNIHESYVSSFPMSNMPIINWKKINNGIEEYEYMNATKNIWSWQYTPNDFMIELKRRGFSFFFQHSDEEVIEIADRIHAEVKVDYSEVANIPFWYRTHVFSI